MSGGHFNYTQYPIQEAARDVQLLIDNNGNLEVDRWGERLHYNFSPEVIEKFREAQKTLEKAGKMLHEVDYLVSGDTGEDSFMIRWKRDVEGIKE